MTANDIKIRENKKLGEKYYYFKHSSGLSVYVFPKELTSAYALFGTKYGSIDNCFRIGKDSEFTRVPDGIAHFLEHKMFDNEDGSDTFAKFAELGAFSNAYTSFDRT
ncbi:MAG: insulinase family protein, partial [Clostridia bacterium]|nr:insulinase family protein [Clostridia bacterium]